MIPEKDARLPKTKSTRRVSWHWLNMDRYTLVKLGLLAILGIILLVVGQLAKSPASSVEAPSVPALTPKVAASVRNMPSQSYQEELEQRLATTLSQIRGAGQVLVQLSLEGGNRVVYATNQQEELRHIEEQAPAGTVRVNEEKRTEAQLVMARDGNTELPIVVDETLPTIQGVLVIADGASSPLIKEELSHAVQVLLGLPAHKVKVLEGEDR